MADFDLSVAPADGSSTCRRQVADWTAPGVYATGGYAITPAEVRMGKIFAFLVASIGGVAVAGAAYLPSYDPVTGRLFFFDAVTGAEAVAGTVFTGATLRVEVIGQ